MSDRDIVRGELTELKPKVQAAGLVLHAHALNQALALTNGNRGSVEAATDQLATLTAVILADRMTEHARHMRECPLTGFVQQRQDGTHVLDEDRLAEAVIERLDAVEAKPEAKVGAVAPVKPVFTGKLATVVAFLNVLRPFAWPLVFISFSPHFPGVIRAVWGMFQNGG